SDRARVGLGLRWRFERRGRLRAVPAGEDRPALRDGLDPDRARSGVPAASAGRMRLRLPITIRLTLAFALSMAVLLGAAGTFLYVRLSTELRTSADTALRAQADVLVSGIGQGEMAFGDATGAAVQEGQPFAQIVTPRGQVVESTEIVAGRPIVAPSVLRSLRR